jgi:hypothetical protein
MTDNKMMHLLLIKLKVTAIALVLAVVCLFLFSFDTSRRMADDIWKQLGLSKEQGMDGVKQSFLNGYLSYYAARNAKNIAVGNRAAVAKDLLSYTKQYISSDAFRKEYELLRKNAKPVEPEAKVISKEEIRKTKIAETEKSIKSSEEIIKKMGGDMEKAMRPTIEMFQKDLADYKEPNSKKIENFYQWALQEQDNMKKEHLERMARWEKEYPADFRQVVKLRLQKYLELAATVDFNAELKQVGNKKKFVNSQYEGKAYNWKQIFRAGKEVYDVAKPFAESWIKELETGK